MPQVISVDEFRNQTRSLVGLPVSAVWRGLGSTVFFEFGELRQGRTKQAKGEATAMIEWSWRVEKAKSVMLGSFSGEQKIARGLQPLAGRKVIEVAIEGRLPELVISIAGGRWIHSFTTVEGHPGWTLFLPGDICLSSRLGRLEKEACAAAYKS